MNLAPTFQEPPTRDEQLTARLTAAQLQALDAYAERQGLTRAQAVRQAIGVALIHERDATPTAI